MREHRAALAAKLDGCGRRAQALFCLACAERLLGCCWCFQRSTGVDVGEFFRGVDKLFTGATKNALDDIDLEAVSQQLEVTIPAGDEYGFPLAVQAQGAFLCALSAVRILAGEGATEAIVDAANSVVDALDNYTFFVAETLAGRTDSPEDYELLRRERARQMHDCDFLCNEAALVESALLEWRIENRQYAVPAALDALSHN